MHTGFVRNPVSDYKVEGNPARHNVNLWSYIHVPMKDRETENFLFSNGDLLFCPVNVL